MLLNAQRTLTFGEFRFVMRPHPHRREVTLYQLFREDIEVSGGEPQQFRLLRFLADEHPGERMTEEDIREALWKGQFGGNVTTQMSILRKLLGDEKSNPKYIKTYSNHGGYQFIATVNSEGDLGRIDGLLHWSPERFHEFLKGVQHDPTSKNGDIRIVTVGLIPNLQDIDFPDFLRRQISFKIVLMNPDNKVLMHSRFDMRKDDVDYAEGRKNIIGQIARLKELKNDYPKANLDIRLSDAMPSGLIIHTDKMALLGMFPAQGSYIVGPMIEVPADTSLCSMLFTEWDIRWRSPAMTPRYQAFVKATVKARKG